MGKFQKEYKCALVFTHDLIGGKWKLRILWHIIHGDNRFSMLKKAIPDITEKVLYTQLRDLEKSGIIEKEIVNVQPPKTVLYHLREENRDLVPLIEDTCRFTKQYASRNNIQIKEPVCNISVSGKEVHTKK